MAKLDEHHKQFIVENLAEFRGYAEVARLLKEEWGIEADRAQVRSYDPSKPAYAGGEHWRAIFEARRKAYLGTYENLPITSEGFRIRELQTFYFRARDAGNIGLALKIFKQVEDMIPTIPPDMIPRPEYMDLTPEERRKRVEEILREALERYRASQTGAPN